MKITLTTLDGNIFPLEVSDDMEILNLKALCEQETQIPINEMSLSFNGIPLNDDFRSLSSYSLKNNDLIMVQRMKKTASSLPFIDFSSISVPQASSSTLSTANNFRNVLMSDRRQFEALQQRFPELASAIQQNDTPRMMQMLGDLTGTGGRSPAREDFQAFMSKEEQERIAEEIRLQNVQQNMESALEHMPEAFGHIVMLYINCRVNGHSVKAFVDSGAQMTIMSSACAERCGIMRLVDKRWAGIAKGVGTQKILGRVHLAQIQIENSFLTTAFSILESQPMDMLLGLDILRRHQCVIDLQRNVLVINSANVETTFLSESELPYFARPHEENEMLDEASNVPTSSQSQVDKYSESTIDSLVKRGYTRQDVISALNETDGDVNMAQVKLLAKSFQVPSKKK